MSFYWFTSRLLPFLEVVSTQWEWHLCSYLPLWLVTAETVRVLYLFYSLERLTSVYLAHASLKYEAQHTLRSSWWAVSSHHCCWLSRNSGLRNSGLRILLFLAERSVLNVCLGKSRKWYRGKYFTWWITWEERFLSSVIVLSITYLSWVIWHCPLDALGMWIENMRH